MKKRNATKSINLDPEAYKAFTELKKTLSEETKRAQPDFSRTFILTTDASANAIGGILSQKAEDGSEKMIFAYSKTLDEAQKNYSVTDKELLACVKCMETFKRYLIGKKFLLRTDHKAIKYLRETKNENSRLFRWSLKLSEYDFDIHYIEGRENQADGLSRYVNQIKTLGDRRKRVNGENRTELLKNIHEISGHGSARTMKFLLRNLSCWEGMFRDIDEYVRKCTTCLKSGDERVNTKNRVIETLTKNDLWECDLIVRIQRKMKDLNISLSQSTTIRSGSKLRQ